MMRHDSILIARAVRASRFCYRFSIELLGFGFGNGVSERNSNSEWNSADVDEYKIRADGVFRKGQLPRTSLALPEEEEEENSNATNGKE
jgi:hypothetical protein